MRRVAPHPWDTGAAQVALSVDDIDGAVEKMTHHAWKLADAVVMSIFGKAALRTSATEGVTFELVELPAGHRRSMVELSMFARLPGGSR